jgi:hypothetical protein
MHYYISTSKWWFIAVNTTSEINQEKINWGQKINNRFTFVAIIHQTLDAAGELSCSLSSSDN